MRSSTTPEWVPDPVKHEAERLLTHAQRPGEIALIHRLLEHEDMKRVWRSIRKVYESDPRYQFILQEFFYTAYDYACGDLRVVTTSNLESFYAPDQKLARKLRKAAAELRKTVWGGDDKETHAQAIERAADFLEECIDWCMAPTPDVVRRDTGRGRERRYVRELAVYLPSGKRLLNVIRIMANVALEPNVKINSFMVRDWCSDL